MISISPPARSLNMFDANVSQRANGVTSLHEMRGHRVSPGVLILLLCSAILVFRARFVFPTYIT